MTGVGSNSILGSTASARGRRMLDEDEDEDRNVGRSLSKAQAWSVNSSCG